MSDLPPPIGHNGPPRDVPSDSRFSVPALVTYWLLAIWAFITYRLIDALIYQVMANAVNPVLLAAVSGLIGTQTTLLVSAVSFWVGATVGGKQATERLAEAQKVSSAALTTIAKSASQADGAPTGTSADPPADALTTAAPSGTPADPVSVAVVDQPEDQPKP